MSAGLSFRCEAAIQLPTNLNKEDRITALSIVGLGMSGKLLSDPYPMGGYSGLEAGVSIESLQVSDLGRLGSGLRSPQQEASIPKFSIGKGLFNNIDLVLAFTPYQRQDEVSYFGGLIRWGFYQATFLPVSLGLLAHASSLNVANALIATTYGVDLIAGIDVEDVALYAGFGGAQADGTFAGGDTHLTASGIQEFEYVNQMHTVIGSSLRFANFLLAFEIDRYTQTVFSGKFGVRF